VFSKCRRKVQRSNESSAGVLHMNGAKNVQYGSEIDGGARSPPGPSGDSKTTETCSACHQQCRLNTWKRRNVRRKKEKERGVLRKPAAKIHRLGEEQDEFGKL